MIPSILPGHPSWETISVPSINSDNYINESSKQPSRRGSRKAPECLDSVHIYVRLRELLKAENRCFYRCSLFAGTGPHVISTYNTAGWREATVSTCSSLLNRFMIEVSIQYAGNLVGILVAYLGLSPIRLLSPILFTEQGSRESIISYVSWTFFTSRISFRFPRIRFPSTMAVICSRERD